MLLYATQKIALGVFEWLDSFVILARRGYVASSGTLRPILYTTNSP
ncbi:hypothetical protein [Mesorhizobium sp.]|nr:hypothetical protein [Mesorhizobium sp.]